MSLINIKSYHHLTHSYNLVYYRASSRMYSLVNSLYFHWLFAILLCSDWLTVNQKSYLGSALHNPSCQVRLFLFPVLKAKFTFVVHISSFQVNFYIFDLWLRYCRSQVKNMGKSQKLKIPQEPKINRIPKIPQKKTASSRMHSLPFQATFVSM